jgi:hypothetical protein
MSAEPDLVDRGVHNFESELEILVEQYRGRTASAGPLGLLLAMPLYASDSATPARVATLTIQPGEVTVLHLRPGFESTIHLPEEVTSVVLGSPGAFKAEHSEGEPNYVYVKPIKREASQSNLLISTRSGQHVSLSSSMTALTAVRRQLISCSITKWPAASW